MSSVEQRQNLLSWIEQARQDGASQQAACQQLGLSPRCVQRWRKPSQGQGDRRVPSLRRARCPANKLDEQERAAVLTTLNSEPYKDLPPSQIVPRLADEGRYVASESTMYRILREAGQLKHRRLERVPQKRTKPRALVAIQPNQIYCWDITYLPTQIRGQFFYLYLFEDLFSRKIVGWQVFDSERAELASELLRSICEREEIMPNQLTVHSDNGAPMKGETMLATMQRLQVAHTRSRPSVSNDNPYIEATFRTLKYRPQLPVKPFDSLLAARRWVTELVHWYNEQHRHSAIGFVTPGQRHVGQDYALLEKRAKVYELARQQNPQRWAGQPRQWHYIDAVHLNPDSHKTKASKSDQMAA